MLAADEVDTTGEQSQVEEQDSSRRIAEALADILRSPRFKDSPQFQNLLQYVVCEALKGDDDALKERMIGMNVFGRRPDYDTTNDPIVRSRMGLLRKRLAQYYEGNDGEHAAVQIVIPTGAYRPSFVFRPDAEKPRTEGVRNGTKVPSLSIEGVERFPGNPVVPPNMVRRTSVAIVFPWSSETARKFKIVAVVAAAVLILIGAWWLFRRTAPSELDLLWAPIVKSKQPVYVYTGTMPVFEEETPLDEATSPEDRTSPVRVPEPPSVDAPRIGPDRVFSWGEGMLTGSVYADIRLAAFLRGYNQTPVMRTGANLPFMDLKGSPLILVGSFDNYWTRVINENLPFYLDRGFGIREREGTHRRWFNPLKAEMTPRMMEDYALVFRILNSKNGAPVLGIVGLSTCGTHAAADFVTDPVQMRALSGISRGSLTNKNIELVLHTSLVNCAPTSVEIIASKVW
ncbi:hypothetical protein [Granulicella sp. S156]|uniref:hypothetical protein n=1 Tax=Granulicella sp. S156 TaxID=1747224 RepID=UPI00131C3755|nr:hypothetical protein [Granulicella sp. S156]